MRIVGIFFHSDAQLGYLPPNSNTNVGGRNKWLADFVFLSKV